MTTLDNRPTVEHPPPADRAALQAFMSRLYEGRLPTSVVDDRRAQARSGP
jgi:hypothetical protein